MNQDAPPPSAALRTITDADADAIAERVAKRLLAASGARGGGINPAHAYSVESAAPLVAMAPKTLRGKLRDGIVKGRRKNGGSWRVLGSELLKFAN